jgi:hypothetical protein
MTSQIFMWYVFPYLVGFAGIGWLIYDSRRSKHRQHPGE